MGFNWDTVPPAESLLIESISIPTVHFSPNLHGPFVGPSVALIQTNDPISQGSMVQVLLSIMAQVRRRFSIDNSN